MSAVPAGDFVAAPFTLMESQVFKTHNESEHADASTPCATGSPTVTLADTPNTGRTRSNPSTIKPIRGGSIPPLCAQARPPIINHKAEALRA